MTAHAAQDLPTVVAEDFDEGVIKDCDSDAEAAAQAPSAAGTGIGGSLDADMDLTQDSASGGADCRYPLDRRFPTLPASSASAHASCAERQGKLVRTPA